MCNSPYLFTVSLILEENIPLAIKAGFRVEEVTPDRVSIGGTIVENSNHHNTVYGVSSSVILILAAWGQVQDCVDDIDPSASIVIAKQSLDFLRPVKKDFSAVCRKPSVTLLRDFSAEFDSRGRARLTVVSELFGKGGIEACAVMSGTFHVSI